MDPDGKTAITCPTARTAPDGTPHTVVGCGSSNVRQDEDEPHVYDCLACGIWFEPRREDAPARTAWQERKEILRVAYVKAQRAAKEAERAFYACFDDPDAPGNDTPTGIAS